MSSIPTGISDIPIEVLDRILDFLHDDLKALYSASLVSRRWVSAPRHHLFERTTVAEEYPERRRRTMDNARSFLDLFQSEHCTILPAIREIALLATTPSLIEDIVKVLARLGRPTRMVYAHLSRSKSISWNARALPTIYDFTLHMWPTFGMDAFRLIASFPNLHTLAICVYDSTATITLPSRIDRASFRNLKTLRLHLLASEELFNWLAQDHLDGSYFILETLDLRMLRGSRCHNGWGFAAALNLFLKEISDTLKNLSLEIDYLLEQDEAHLPNEKASRIDLNRLTNLRSVSFRTHDINAICTSLASLNSSLTTLEVLTVHILRWDFLQMERCDCILSTLLERLASIMEEKHVIGTETLRTKVPYNMEADVVVDMLLIWNRSGALELTNTDDTNELSSR